MKPIQIAIIVAILVLVAAFVGIIIGQLDPIYFWVVIVLGAVFAYVVLPRLRNN